LQDKFLGIEAVLVGGSFEDLNLDFSVFDCFIRVDYKRTAALSLRAQDNSSSIFHAEQFGVEWIDRWQNRFAEIKQEVC
jgi:hypothetical protein